MISQTITILELQKLFTDLESKFSGNSNQDFKAILGN